MSLFDSIVKETVGVLKTAGESVVGAVDEAAAAYMKKVNRPTLTLESCRRNWKDERVFVANDSYVAYTGVPEKATKTITLLNASNQPAALIGFGKRKIVTISILDINFTFDLDFKKDGVLFSVEGLTVISRSERIIRIMNDGTEAVEIRYKHGRWFVSYDEERFSCLGAAVCVAVNKMRNP